MAITKSLPFAMIAASLVAGNLNLSALTQQEQFKPLPIDFYSQMVGRLEALCELVERGDLTPSQVRDQYHEDIRDARDISPKQMINAIKAYNTVIETYPHCTQQETKQKAPQKQQHFLNNL